MEYCCGSPGTVGCGSGASGELAGGAVGDKARQHEEEEEEKAGRAMSQSVSAPCSESEETASLKGPASTSLIRQKWKKVSQPNSKLQGCKHDQ